MKRKAILATKMPICPACFSGSRHWECERGICLCWKTAHQTNPSLNRKPETLDELPYALIWCHKCDRSFQKNPIAGVCEFCGGELSTQRNIVLRRQWGDLRRRPR